MLLKSIFHFSLVKTFNTKQIEQYEKVDTMCMGINSLASLRP